MLPNAMGLCADYYDVSGDYVRVPNDAQTFRPNHAGGEFRHTPLTSQRNQDSLNVDRLCRQIHREGLTVLVVSGGH
ncbi:MAG: hypothetical protein QOF51_336 [Chloroflexota bacterium]|nr:hypothetical protein [Chloroflexota bacterium]